MARFWPTKNIGLTFLGKIGPEPQIKYYSENKKNPVILSKIENLQKMGQNLIANPRETGPNRT